MKRAHSRYLKEAMADIRAQVGGNVTKSAGMNAGVYLGIPDETTAVAVAKITGSRVTVSEVRYRRKNWERWSDAFEGEAPITNEAALEAEIEMAGSVVFPGLPVSSPCIDADGNIVTAPAPKPRGRPKKAQTEDAPEKPKRRGRKPASEKPAAKKRGRPKKAQTEDAPEKLVKRRGRPRKETPAETTKSAPKRRRRRSAQSEGDSPEAPPKRRGRPRKDPEPEIEPDEDLDLFEPEEAEESEIPEGFEEGEAEQEGEDAPEKPRHTDFSDLEF